MNSRFSKLGVAILMWITLEPVSAICCEYPPAEQQVPYWELVRRTQRVVVASPTQVVGTSPFHVTYKFTVERSLKGDVRKSFEIEGREKRYSGMDTNCEIYPGFDLGRRYLVFIDRPYHELSFEELRGDDDPWLEKIETEIAKQTRQ